MNDTHKKQLTIWRNFIDDFFYENFLVAYNESVLEIGVVQQGRYKNLLDDEAPHRDTLDKYVESTYTIDVNDIEDHIEQESYDVIICSETLEHLERPWEIAEKITRILKQCGSLYITVPSFLFWHPGGKFYKDHWRFLPLKSLDILFPKLTKIKYDYCHPEEYKAYPIGQVAVFQKI